MFRYDPSTAPSPKKWGGPDDGERIAHRAYRRRVCIRLPNATLGTMIRSFAAALIVLAVTVAIAAPSAQAGQISFSERPGSDGLEFQVVFSDSQLRSWTVSFVLPMTVVHDDAGYARYNQATLMSQVSAATTAAVLPYHGLVAADIRPARDGYELAVRSRASQPIGDLMTTLRSAARGAADTYFSQHGLILLHGRDIIPDYGRMALHFVPGLQPLALALAGLVPNGSDRARLALALAFIQNIPYDPVAAGRPDNGFEVPSIFLVQNKGDCDTKTVAMASLLGTLLPRVATVIVIIPGHPGHAILGAALPLQAGERSLHYEGRDYLLMEPVGPALMLPGIVSHVSWRGLGRFNELIVVPVVTAEP